MGTHRRRLAWLTFLVACSGGEVATTNQDPGGSDGMGDQDGGATLADGAHEEQDGGPGPADVPASPPSYCTGIVFYASFDNGFEQAIADASVRVVGSTSPATGRFGNAAAFVDAGPDGAAIYYDGPEGGTIFPVAEGTVAFWFHKEQQPATNLPLVYVRPLTTPTALQTAGPVAESFNGSIGLFDDLAGPPILTLNETTLSPYVRNGDFNHFAFGWKAPNDAGPSHAVVAVNGGLGQVLSDAGADATFDAAPNEAGGVDTPYYREGQAGKWTAYPVPPRTLRLGGTAATYPRGEMDDFAIWNRVLAAPEIAELYASPTAIKVRCGLP